MSDPRSPASAAIGDDAFEQVVQQAIVRPAGRSFRGEPARQVQILRYLKSAGGRVGFAELHDHLRSQRVVRSQRDDDAARRKAIGQAVDAINTKLGTFFFRVRDPRLLEEMFRIEVHAEDPARPAYSLQDFFEVRKLSGVRFYASTADPAGGITQEIYELVTRIRPARLDMMAPSLEPFFGNPEFRSMVASSLEADPDGRVRVLLLDPACPAAAAAEEKESAETTLLGPLRERTRATLVHIAQVAGALPSPVRGRLEVRLSPDTALWRFRMVFLPDVLHLRLSAPGAAGQTLIKLGVSSALYTSLRDVFEQQWAKAREAPPAEGR